LKKGEKEKDGHASVGREAELNQREREDSRGIVRNRAPHSNRKMEGLITLPKKREKTEKIC